jgi:histidine triad (HIT) family protein
MLPLGVKKLIFYSYKKGMMKMFGCIFCRIAAHKAPASILYEDEQCVVFRDINPKAPVHLLVIPRKHISSLNESLDGDAALLGHMLMVVGRMAKGQDIDGSGFRTVIHLHIHILGGRTLGWPPG